MAISVVLTAEGGIPEAQQFAFAGPAKVVIGRSPNCTARLVGDLSVSRRHCLVGVDEEGAWVEDLDSRNGTFVNGYLIGRRTRDCEEGLSLRSPPRPLEEGDEVQVGSYTLHVHVVNEGPAEGEGATVPGQAGRELCEAGA